MRRLYLLLSAVVLGCAVVGCVSPEQVKLPDDPDDPGQLSEFQDAIRDLPQDEQKDINDFIARMATVKAAGGYGYVVGTRAKEALEKQRAWLAEEKEREHAQRELEEKLAREEAEKNAAKAEAARKLHGICEVSLVKKKLAGARLSMTLKFENRGDKEIVAGMGKLQFHDTGGKLLKEIRIPIQESIKAKKSVTWSGDLPCNMTKEQDVTLSKIPISDLKVSWVPERYDFADGTKVGMGL